jgi:ZIP family zinc transporter
MTTLIIGLLIPLLGTMLGSAFVFFMKDVVLMMVLDVVMG